MTPDDARKLLGGYATGTLTEAEEQALFAAALEDQALFDELAREQALRDLLREGSARAQLLAALDEPRRPWWQSWRPAAAVLAMAGVAAVAVVVVKQKAPAPTHVQLTARVDAPLAAPVQSESAPPAIAPAGQEGAPPAAPKAQAKRRTFQAPAPPSPAPAPVAATELAEAPKVEIHNLEDRAPGRGGVIGGVIGGVPGTLPPPPPIQTTVVTPMFETASDARLQFQAGMVEALRPSARALFLTGTQAPLRIQQTAMARSGNASHSIGLRYSIVRNDREETVAIRFTANVNGYLSLGGGAPVALTAMQPYTTPPLKDKEVKVVFARQPQTSITTPVAPLTEVSGGETYVVNTLPTGALGFTIPLTQK